MKFLFGSKNKLNLTLLDFIIYSVILIYTLIYLVKAMLFTYDYYILEGSSQIMVNHMNPSVSTSTSDNNSTLVTRDGTWNQVIRSLFIYGTGIARYQLVRSGSPAQKAFCICSTMALDAAGNVAANLINDPNYVRANIQNWRILQRGNTTGEYEVDISADKKTFDAIKKEESNKNSFLPEDFDIDKIQNQIMDIIMDYIRPYIQPVTVNYSHDLLVDQVQILSLISLIIALIITGMLLFLFLNIFIYMNSDRILKLFKNKYVVLYVNLQLKFIAIEVILSTLVILYGMGILIYALHFIVTHPLH